MLQLKVGAFAVIHGVLRAVYILQKLFTENETMIKRYYNSIMDSNLNPLRNLPASQRLQTMMLLSWMWSVVFGLLIGSYLAFGVSVVAHLALLVAGFITVEVFRRAEEHNVSYDGLHKDPHDGTALNDDIWGAPDKLVPAKVKSRR